jgi:hypothetical protein
MDFPLSPSNRKRDQNNAALRIVDLRLIRWGRWASEQSSGLGYPHLSLIYKVLRRHAKRLGKLDVSLEGRLKGLTARGTETRSLRPRLVGEVPPEIAEVDRVVARLPPDVSQILQVEYVRAEEPIEIKAALLDVCITEYKSALRRAKLTVSRRLFVS